MNIQLGNLYTITLIGSRSTTHVVRVLHATDSGTFRIQYLDAFTPAHRDYRGSRGYASADTLTPYTTN